MKQAELGCLRAFFETSTLFLNRHVGATIIPWTLSILQELKQLACYSTPSKPVAGALYLILVPRHRLFRLIWLSKFPAKAEECAGHTRLWIFVRKLFCWSFSTGANRLSGYAPQDCCFAKNRFEPVHTSDFVVSCRSLAEPRCGT